MTESLRLTRLVTIEECPWLYRDYEQGEIVYRYNGHTYGVISPSGLACYETPGKTLFFELPADALERTI